MSATTNAARYANVVREIDATGDFMTSGPSGENPYLEIARRFAPVVPAAARDLRRLLDAQEAAARLLTR